jgi:hypothetical protein
MAEPKRQAWLEAQTAYAEKYQQLLELRDLSESQLGRDLRARKTPVNTKTLNNIGNIAHPTQLDNLTAVADYFGLPLWVMFLPGMPQAMLPKAFSNRLIKMMADYLDCDDADRLEVEKLASVYAEKKRRSK